MASTPTGPLPGFMRLYAETRGFMMGRPSAFKATPDGKQVLFLRGQARKAQLTLFETDVATGVTRELLTPEKLLAGAVESLSVEEKARRERMRITVGGFTSFELSDDGKLLLLQLSGKLYTYNRSSGVVVELSDAAGALDPRFVPGGAAVSYVKDNDVHVLDLASLKERRVTTNGQPLITHGLAEFVAQEEMGRMRGYWWSSDAKLLAFEEADSNALEEFHIQDPMHPEQKPVAFRYPRAGKTNALVKLGIVGASGGRPVWVSWDAVRFPYLASVTWPAKGPLTLLVQSRDQKDQVLLAVNPATGRSETLLAEHDDAWLNLDVGMPMWLPDGSGFLWTTERNGAWELELRDATGKLKQSLLGPNAGLQDVLDLDAQGGRVFVLASADPTSSHLLQVPLAGGPAVQLTHGPGRRTITMAAAHGFFVEGHSGPDAWRSVDIKALDGTVKGVIPQVAETPPFSPNATWEKVGDGAGFHTITLRPRDFDASKRYPVILSVYGGPHHNMVHASREPYLREQWMADHGYIVVCADGRGTMFRGRAWERAISQDFSTAPLQDQVSALKLLGALHPEMDMARVGVLGWSFGGFMSGLAVLRRPDVFKTAVAGAPVVDWLDYDTHYTERYLGLPDANAEGYRKSNLMTYAAGLERPLLLVHGTADDNVYFFHSLKLSDALTRAGRAHSVLPLAGFTHMVPEPAMVEALWNRMLGFLGETLHPAN